MRDHDALSPWRRRAGRTFLLILLALLPLLFGAVAQPHRAQAQAGPTLTGVSGLSEGQTVSGTIFVQALVSGGDADTQVEFDLTNRCTTLLTESVAPYWLGGDTGPGGQPPNEPNGFDTTVMGCNDGRSTLVVRLRQSGAYVAGQVLVVHFTVSNTAPTPTFTPTPTPTPTPTFTPTWTPTATATSTPTPGARPSITGFEGHGSGTVSGVVSIQALVAVPGGAAVDRVEFDFSNACGPDNTERVAPYFWNGDISGDPAGFNTALCADTAYTLTATVYDAQGLADTEVLTLTIANGAATATPTPQPTPTPGGTLTPTLLDSYDTNGYASEYAALLYRPRGFVQGVQYADPNWGTETVQNAGGFSGWDVLFTCSEGICRTDPLRNAGPDWLLLELNRSARLGVVWRAGGSLPTWLQTGWTNAGTVTTTGGTYPVYTKNVSAGIAGLGPVQGTPQAPRDAYWVLLAESGGVPSQAPPQLGSPAAQPNQTCPTWVHDRYTTTIASGAGAGTYRTWHRQIDPVYWCYFRHDHGSDPAPFGNGSYKPAFHVASTVGGPSFAEPHEQFKTAGFTTAAVGGTVLDWYFTIHFGTSNAQRGACNRFHEVRVAVANDQTGELLADVTWHADFGATIRNTGAPTPLDLSGLGCPNQADIQNQSASNKLVPVTPTGANDPELVMYYPWRQAERSGVLGIAGVFLMNTTDAIAVCHTMTCDQNILTGAKGTERFMQYSSDFGLRNPAATGTFCTNVTAEFLMTCTLQGAVPQYVNPNANITMPNLSINGGIVNGPGYSNVFDAWYTVVPDPENPVQSNSLELEQSIQSPN